jgi:hemin uptake protein HemP
MEEIKKTCGSDHASEGPKPSKNLETESLPIYDSVDLLKGGREILIRHHGEVYRLRLTRNDKLILNK